MSVYKRNYGTTQPLKFPNTPEAYELRLTDDDEEVYTPNREIAALDRNSPLEQFPALAFVEVNNFKQREDNSPKKLNELQIA